MGKQIIPFQVYSSVKVKDETLERHGQVGVVIGSTDDAETPVEVKFDVEGGYKVEHYAIESLEGL